MSQKIEPGDLCVVVREAPGFEMNLGIFVRVLVLTACDCGNPGCSGQSWSYEQASRAVCDCIVQDHLFGPWRPHSFCTSTAASKWSSRFNPHFLQPIKGQPQAEEEERIVGLKHPFFGVELA